MKKILWVTFVAVMACTGLSHADSNLFYPYVAFSTGSWPEAVAVGDVNGDGHNDVVMVTSFDFDPDNDYHLFVFLQNTSGELDPPITYVTSGTYTQRPISVAVGDVNNDGRTDVVVGEADARIEVFLQNGSGSLDPPTAYATSDSRSIKIADLNDDGLLDVVGIGWGTDTVSIYFQNASGTLNPSVTYSVTHGGYDEVDVGDVNHDGLTDIIVMSGQLYSVPNIGVLLQQEGGTFGSPVYYEVGIDELTSGVAVGDVNGDGFQDVVVTYGGNDPDSRIGVFFQNGSGTLDPVVSYGSYDCPEPVVIADVSQDGRQDIIVAHGGWHALGVYTQWEDGILAPEALYDLPYATAYNPQGLVVGDINGDGHPDVVIADYNHGLVVLYHRKDEPDISVSPSQVSFGPVALGDTVSSTVTIQNAGAVLLNVGTLSITGTDASQFQKGNDSCSSSALTPGSTCSTDIVFSPTTKGPKSSTLTIPSDDPDMPSLTVPIEAYGRLKLLSPNGGEILPRGSTYRIQWVAPSQAVSFNLSYSIDNGSTWKSIVGRTWGTSYDWEVPVLANNRKGLVRVTGLNSRRITIGEDRSDSTFTIEGVRILLPNGAETLKSGETQLIAWDTNATAEDVATTKIHLSKDGGMTWSLIASLQGNPGSYHWAVALVPAIKSKCKLKSVLKNKKGKILGSDVSDAVFTIVP